MQILWCLSLMARMGNLLTRREGTFCNPSGILIQARAQQWMLIPLGERYIPKYYPHSVQFSSVTQTCPTLCDPMNCSTPGLPVHHHLPEFTQTHVHQVSDAIQPSHPLLSPSPPAPNPSQHQNLFQRVYSCTLIWLLMNLILGISEYQHSNLGRNWIVNQ